ncbi:4Fe-4S dicluster domain-containing protein [Eggerthella sp. NSJ-70]|uniref:4Fe-4S dicluster domain-containing protein n=2 Tax=Eggerthella TaxID=84111 RepID=A0A6N7RSR3_9ACTN|nr:MULTISPECIES: 4Fe-4S dicluster domain-containing protein [Eggerthella]MBC5585699.1 4Fe-4S dicluster domain-containing protein [Eggerthella hominis]MRX84041.1 4Fe-4S dicluster domain-containing protein [Eggerthella guodeyinii]
MTRFGMLIDTNRCISCYACRTACQSLNNLGQREAFVTYEQREAGSYPHARVETVPLQCMHCDDAPCVRVCPTGASRINENGIVSVDHGRCIGCKYCMAACPYQVRVQNEETGVVDKCRFCTASALDGATISSCVEVCPTKARIFGDLDDPESELSKAIVASNAVPLAGDLTKAKVFYAR